MTGNINQGNWLSENYNLRYPFDDNVDADFHKLVVDFRLILESKTSAVKYRISDLTIDDLSAIPPWYDAEISPPGPPVVDWLDAEISPPGPSTPNYFHALISTLLSGNITVREVVSNNIVFTGQLQNAYLWGSGGEWVSFTASNTTGSLVIVFDYANLLLYTGVVPAQTTLIDSVVEGKARNIRRMFIKNYPADSAKTIPAYGATEGPTELSAITNKVVLKGGYNTGVSLNLETSPERVQGSLSLSMLPGEGIGKFVICDDIGIKSINNNQPAVDGSMLLTPSGTLNYEITDATYTPFPVPNTIRLTSNSNPCCSCTDYITAYTALVNEYNLARRIGFRLNKIRDLYNVIREKLIQEKAARETGLNIKTNLHVRPGRVIAIMAEIRNAASTPLSGITSIKFILTGATATFIRGSGILVTTTALRDTVQVDPTVAGNEFTVFLGTPLEAYGWVQYTFQVSFPSVGSINCNTSIVGYAISDTSSIYVRNL